MALVSFAQDIRGLFRAMDIQHMKDFEVYLDDYNYMADPANNHRNAEVVEETVSPHGSAPPTMPPGGPYWTAEQIALFKKWRRDGYLP